MDKKPISEIKILVSVCLLVMITFLLIQKYMTRVPEPYVVSFQVISHGTMTHVGSMAMDLPRNITVSQITGYIRARNGITSTNEAVLIMAISKLP